MKRYLLLAAAAALLQSCSGKSDAALYGEGSAAVEAKNFPLAVERFEEVVNRFQKSAYAESALYRAALVYNNDLHDQRKAVAAYRKFYELYPESKQAPTSLFLAGFLLNNELHQLDSAKVVYETFLMKYPSHELAASAKFELETLGKEPAPLMNPDTSAAPREGSRPAARASSQ
jgi:outer membrane protein assembly factor BamD (BamD/ComL family)